MPKRNLFTDLILSLHILKFKRNYFNRLCKKCIKFKQRFSQRMQNEHYILPLWWQLNKITEALHIIFWAMLGKNYDPVSSWICSWHLLPGKMATKWQIQSNKSRTDTTMYLLYSVVHKIYTVHQLMLAGVSLYVPGPLLTDVCQCAVKKPHLTLRDAFISWCD